MRVFTRSSLMVRISRVVYTSIDCMRVILFRPASSRYYDSSFSIGKIRSPGSNVRASFPRDNYLRFPVFLGPISLNGIFLNPGISL
jgi:hypothetical protein